MIPGFTFPIKRPMQVVNIRATTSNYNLFEAMGEPENPAEVMLVVAAGALVYGETAADFCITTQGMPLGSLLYLVNKGSLFGAGGNGGEAIAVTVGPNGNGVYSTTYNIPQSGCGAQGYIAGQAGASHLVYVYRGGFWQQETETARGEAGDFVAGGGSPDEDEIFRFNILDSYPLPTILGRVNEEEVSVSETDTEFHMPTVASDPDRFWETHGGGEDGGSCLELTIPTIIHNTGFIFGGGGGGAGGNGFGCYWVGETDTPTYTYPGTIKADPVSASDKAHMAACAGGDWGEAGDPGYFTEARQNHIYGGVKYTSGAAGNSVVHDNGIPVHFTTGSDDPAKLKGPILELP